MRVKAPEQQADATEPSHPGPEPVSRPVRLPLGRDDEIAAGVHEVQNALTAVVGWLELARGSSDQALRERALRAIETGVHRAKSLVSRLADPAERFSVRSRAFRVAPILAETHELLHPRCASVGVALTVDAPDDGVVALGDPDRLEQIVSNLVLNAVDAVLALPGRDEQRGRVHVRIVGDERHVSIVVQDDGVGMDEATRTRIFEPYFTTHPHAEGRRRAGTGLGLSVSRALAEAMAGTLSVASTPGVGTTVTLRLAREGVVPSVNPPPEGTDLRPGTRVLVVDDEPAIRELLEVALTLRGAEVTAAGSLDEARRQLTTNSFEVVLVDETLGPQESGAALVVELSQTTPQLARVLMTGAPTLDHLPPEASRWLLRKPFALDDVVRLIAAALEEDAGRISRTQ
jgi:CheY-like chemotaxis protein/anti-sigma regulatory factor (Ser/Thr protein kinase)